MTDRDAIDLLESILQGVPPLPGAHCTSSPQLFDLADPDEPRDEATHRHAIALDMCHDCPVLAACETWARSLDPAARPTGVLAGTIYGRPGHRRPRAAA